MYDKNKTCCFSGHRPEKMTIPTEKLKINLELQLRKSIGDGYTTFFAVWRKGLTFCVQKLC